ncbi:phosphatidylethanolamine-binding protein [Crepidotus variabilis]|uniref:Phosphatidylethanolamine-binding protein n=1 Tax=Crepidotus variabilis TaxID=179855 RepID=A0A9P6E5E6_9AGAR|nr:phosphatidylethanolamine-binding protein [Crepidotus variabilis]
MIALKAFVSLAFFTLANAQDADLGVVKKTFEDAKIPQSLAITFDPCALLEVIFQTDVTKAPIQVVAGVTLQKNDTNTRPTFSVATPENKGVKADDLGPFVLSMVDPDAPTPQNPTVAQIRHFLAGNFYIESEGANSQLVNKTPAISDWRAPNPTQGKDAHRYVFLLYKQPSGFESQTLVNSTTPISTFNISQFAEATGLGQPIAGTFILVAPPVPPA